jgi:hypothetical protein
MPEEYARRRRRLEELHRRGTALAGTLTGLPRDEAVEHVKDAGLHPQVVDPGVTALTMDLRYDRVRIFLGADGAVTRAEAG